MKTLKWDWIDRSERSEGPPKQSESIRWVSTRNTGARISTFYFAHGVENRVFLKKRRAVVTLAQNFFENGWLAVYHIISYRQFNFLFLEGFFPLGFFFLFVFTFYFRVPFPRQRENKFEILLASSSRTKRVVAFAFITFITSITR